MTTAPSPDPIVVFLARCLDDEEQAAGEAQPGPWCVGNAVDPTQPCNVHTFPEARGGAWHAVTARPGAPASRLAAFPWSARCSAAGCRSWTT